MLLHGLDILKGPCLKANKGHCIGSRPRASLISEVSKTRRISFIKCVGQKGLIAFVKGYLYNVEKRTIHMGMATKIRKALFEGIPVEYEGLEKATVI